MMEDRRSKEVSRSKNGWREERIPEATSVDF
jgi:hypothetical protein